MQVVKKCVVIGNGTHTDAIVERLIDGATPEIALANVLLEKGYEEDDHKTPRIAGIVPFEGSTGWLGTVREDAMQVNAVALLRRRIAYVATYDHDRIVPDQQLPVAPGSLEGVVQDTLSPTGNWAHFEHPVTAAAALAIGPSDVGFAVSDA